MVSEVVVGIQEARVWSLSICTKQISKLKFFRPLALEKGESTITLHFEQQSIPQTFALEPVATSMFRHLILVPNHIFYLQQTYHPFC